MLFLVSWEHHVEDLIARNQRNPTMRNCEKCFNVQACDHLIIIWYWSLLAGHWQRVYLLRSIVLPVSERLRPVSDDELFTSRVNNLDRSNSNREQQWATYSRSTKVFQCQWLCNNSRMRLSMKWTIMQIEAECYSPRPKAKVRASERHCPR